MSNAYFTGIDTSDAVSVVSHSLPPNPYAFDPEHGDEPPPPYRPRSVAPISREASTTVRGGSRMLTPPPEEHRTRSPFDDPEDDDDDDDENSSMVFGSGARPVHSQDDRMSDVSDLSYQGPTTAHHSV